MKIVIGENTLRLNTWSENGWIHYQLDNQSHISGVLIDDYSIDGWEICDEDNEKITVSTPDLTGATDGLVYCVETYKKDDENGGMKYIELFIADSDDAEVQEFLDGYC
jgi:hypothetical protein